MENRPIITIDFDGCMSRKDVQEYAKELIERGVDVNVLTSRYDELHKHRYPANPTLDDLYEVTDELGIPRTKIRFQCMVPKAEYLKHSNVIWHLDDYHVELNAINKHTDTVGISCFKSGNWKQKCERLLGFKYHPQTSEKPCE